MKSGKHMKPDFVPVPPLTAKQKKIAFEFWGYRCTSKGCQIITGLDIDHLIPRALGGDNSLKNTRPMCYAHHREKTSKADIPAISKAKGLNKKHYHRELLPEKKKIPSPGWGKQNRPIKSRSSWEKRK